MNMKRIISAVLLLSMAVSAMAQEAPKKYDIKSGIAKINTTIMGQAVESTQYFDNYGVIEASKTKTTVPGAGDIEITTVSKDGKTYAVIPSMKQVQEQTVQESINYLALTDDIVSKYKIQEAGKETICGKECTKYTEEISQQGQKANATVWVYKGFPMKSVTAVAGIELVMEVVEFTEDAFILPNTFEIPSFE